MKRKIQYHLKISQGNISQEEGHFFRATPFLIQFENKQVHVNFKHESHDVVYQLTEKDQIIGTLKHPDYLPNTSIKESNKHLKSSFSSQIIIEAFLQLRISKSKEIVSELESLETSSYEIIQYTFTH